MENVMTANQVYNSVYTELRELSAADLKDAAVEDYGLNFFDVCNLSTAELAAQCATIEVQNYVH
jgi:hypothetical protein